MPYTRLVEFSDSASAALLELAKNTGKSEADVLRDAIALAKFISDLHKAGKRIVVEEDGKLRELITT